MSRDGESVAGSVLLGGRSDENVLPWWPALPCHTRKSYGLSSCGWPGHALGYMMAGLAMILITWFPAWLCFVDYMTASLVVLCGLHDGRPGHDLDYMISGLAVLCGLYDGQPGCALWITWWLTWPGFVSFWIAWWLDWLCSVDYMMAGLARLCQFVDYMMAGLAVLCGLHDGQAHTTYIFRTFAVFTSLCCLTCSMLLVSCYRYTVIGPILFGSWLLWASLPLFTWWSDLPPPSSWGVVGIFALVVYRMIRPASTEFLRCCGNLYLCGLHGDQITLTYFLRCCGHLYLCSLHGDQITLTYFLRCCGNLYLCGLHGDQIYPYLLLEVLWASLPLWFTWWSDYPYLLLEVLWESLPLWFTWWSDLSLPTSWGVAGIFTFVVYMVIRSILTYFLRCCGNLYLCGLHGDQIYPYLLLELLRESLPLWFTWWSDLSLPTSWGAVGIITFVVYMVTRSILTYFLRCCGNLYLCGLHGDQIYPYLLLEVLWAYLPLWFALLTQPLPGTWQMWQYLPV